MFKRFFLLVIFLIVAFYVYRGINPIDSTALIERVKGNYYDLIGKEYNIVEVLPEAEEPIVEILELTGEILLTGDIKLTGDVEINTGEIEELVIETGLQIQEEKEEIIEPEPELEEPIIVPAVEIQEPAPAPKPTSSPSSTTTNTEVTDTQNLINNLFK